MAPGRKQPFVYKVFAGQNKNLSGPTFFTDEIQSPYIFDKHSVVA